MGILLLGAPGVGKGTQAKLISEKFKIPHISTGDLFRFNIDNRTSLGAEAKAYLGTGKLVPDDLTVSMVKERLSQEDCIGGFVLDGFPRNIYQAVELDLFLYEHMKSIDRAVLIDIPTSLIVERTTGRRICSVCGTDYHIKFKKPKFESKCDKCGEQLMQRSDDGEEIVKERLYIHNSNIKPVIDFYSTTRRLSIINGYSDVVSIFNIICSALKAVS